MFVLSWPKLYDLEIKSSVDTKATALQLLSEMAVKGTFVENTYELHLLRMLVGHEYTLTAHTN